jgi:hypothetical protein
MSNRFTLLIVAGMILGIVVGYGCHAAFPDPEDRGDRLGLSHADYHGVPASHQDDHRATGVLDAGGGDRPYGRRERDRADRA